MNNKTKPGEKGFTFILLGLGIFVLVSGLNMYKASPDISSYGAMPLFLGFLLVVLSLILVVQNFRREGELSGMSFADQAKAVMHFLFRKDIVVMIVLLLAYSAALFFGVGFMIATPVYLWVAMCYLSRKDYVKNILWTAILMAFILVVFSVAFRVVLP